MGSGLCSGVSLGAELEPSVRNQREAFRHWGNIENATNILLRGWGSCWEGSLSQGWKVTYDWQEGTHGASRSLQPWGFWNLWRDTGHKREAVSSVRSRAQQSCPNRSQLHDLLTFQTPPSLIFLVCKLRVKIVRIKCVTMSKAHGMVPDTKQVPGRCSCRCGYCHFYYCHRKLEPKYTQICFWALQIKSLSLGNKH